MRLARDLARFGACMGTGVLGLLVGLDAQPHELLATRQQQPLGVGAGLVGDAAGLAARLRQQLLRLLLGGAAKALELGSSLGPNALGLLRRLRPHALGLELGGRPHLVGLLAAVGEQAVGPLMGLGKHPRGLVAHPLGLCVKPRHARQRLVARRLGLRACGAEDLLGLLLGSAHPIFGRPVGLGYPLPRATLGLLAKLERRPFGCSDDARNPPRRAAQGVRIVLSLSRRLWPFLHAAIVNPRPGRRARGQAGGAWQKLWEICPCGQNVRAP